MTDNRFVARLILVALFALLVLGIYMIPGHKPNYETISEARERFRTIYRECHADIGTYKYRSSCEHMYEMSEAEFLKMAIKSWREAHPFY